MTEIGESVDRVDALLKETKIFHSLCETDIERAEEVLSIGTYVLPLKILKRKGNQWEHINNLIKRFVVIGQQLISVRGACPKEMVQPKCDELFRVCEIITERLMKRLENLSKNRDLMERVEKVCYFILIEVVV